MHDIVLYCFLLLKTMYYEEKQFFQSVFLNVILNQAFTFGVFWHQVL